MDVDVSQDDSKEYLEYLRADYATLCASGIQQTTTADDLQERAFSEPFAEPRDVPTLLEPFQDIGPLVDYVVPESVALDACVGLSKTIPNGSESSTTKSRRVSYDQIAQFPYSKNLSFTLDLHFES
jgi:hypothetical protein